jgi:hypothetical protein
MDNPDVLKLFHRHSVWMIRISVLVKVNGIRHYSFIDLILPCFSYKYINIPGGFPTGAGQHHHRSIDSSFRF